MREEVELLEEHSGAQTHLPDLLLVCAGPSVERIGFQEHAVDLDRADGRLLQEVDAAQERRLSRAGSADDHHRLSLADLQVDPAQDVVRAEVLLQPMGPDDDLAEVGRKRRRVATCLRRLALAEVGEGVSGGHWSPSASRRSMAPWTNVKRIVRIQ